MDKINYASLQKTLKKKELQNVLGGSFDTTGVRCHNGICLCDFLFDDGSIWCDHPCNWSTCVDWGCTC